MAGLFIDINRTITGGIDTLAGRIVSNIVNALGDGERRNFLARLGIQHGNHAAATSDKQAMVRFVEGHRHVGLALRYRPTRYELALLPIHNRNLVPSSVI